MWYSGYTDNLNYYINKYTVCFCLKILETEINYSNFLKDKAIHKVLVKQFNQKTHFSFDISLRTLVFYIIMERSLKISKKKINYKIFLKLINSKGNNRILANIIGPNFYYIKSNLHSNDVFNSILNFIDSYCSSHYSTPIWQLNILLQKIKQHKLSFMCSIL